MQGQPLSTHYMTKDESQIKTICVVINFQLEIALKGLSVRLQVWFKEEVTIG